jgi:hypothetical protein
MYMFMPRYQKVDENHILKIANKSFENVAKVQIFGDYNNKSELHLRRN